ncbi:hypothetical protein SDC9_210695 [bioreactor metagenome]|uniref:Uncharacterized protein n=1 Tax=bioreactor metagenome TaxID=1076179 RepID=A0A645JI90_9ZZZZ
MLAAGKAHRQFISDFVGLLRGDLAGKKRLPNLIGDNVPAMLRFSAGNAVVFLLCKQKFRINSLRRAFIGTDIFAVLCLIWIDCIVCPVGKRLSNCLPLLMCMVISRVVAITKPSKLPIRL